MFSNVQLLFLSLYVGNSFGDRISPFLFFGQHDCNLIPKPEASDDADYDYFLQDLDHFNPTNTAQWNQKYLYEIGTTNIVFLNIGGESPIPPYFLGFWNMLAEEVGAYKFLLEHRYYGDSQPYGDLSTAHLKYLTADQALADLASFITAMNEQYNLGEDVKWIVFGCSYPGALAAWLRNLYPHLVYAAVSSSGPLLAKADFSEYLETTIDAFGSSYATCKESIAKAFDEIEYRVENGLTVGSNIFLCDDYTYDDSLDPNQKYSLYRVLITALAFVSQYDGLYPDITVDITCGIMITDVIVTEMERLGLVLQMAATYLSNGRCFDFDYNFYIGSLAQESWSHDSIVRQWTYQTCTEFGYFQTTTSTSDFFGGDTSSLDSSYRTCQDVFGAKFDKDFVDGNINQTNILKGGTDIDVTNVLYVHGSQDPWHNLGIYEDKKNSKAILIEGTAHCSDTYFPEDSDSDELKAARVKIRDTVLGWISDSKK